MPLSFTPSSINLPTPPSYAAAPMGAPVNPNALTALSELGNIQATRQGIATSQQALAKAQATFGADVSIREEEAKQQAIKTNLEELKQTRSHHVNIVDNIADLIKDPNLTQEKIVKKATELNKNQKGNDASLKQFLMSMPDSNDPTTLKQFLTSQQLAVLDAQARLEKTNPSIKFQNVGGAIVPTAEGNPELANVRPGTQVGTAIPTTIAPTVVTNQITGAPYVIGGGRQPGNQPQGGSVPLNQLQPQGQPLTQPQGQPQGQPVQQAPRAVSAPAVQPQGVQGKQQSQLQQLSNESAANFNARVAQVQNSVIQAQDQFTNPNSELGHIPTLQQVNNNIMGLLKDPSVNTGAVQDYLAKRTNKGLSNPKEQELAKYLEQRIQARTPKSDADAESKKAAYGSFNLDKSALMDLVRQDNAWITTQDLRAKGRLFNAGSATSPNFGKVAEFNNQFAQFARDPKLMLYVSLAGENPNKISMDKSDHEAATKYFGNMSKDQKEKLELQRQTLLKLIGAQ